MYELGSCKLVRKITAHFVMRFSKAQAIFPKFKHDAHPIICVQSDIPGKRLRSLLAENSNYSTVFVIEKLLEFNWAFTYEHDVMQRRFRSRTRGVNDRVRALSFSLEITTPSWTKSPWHDLIESSWNHLVSIAGAEEELGWILRTVQQVAGRVQLRAGYGTEAKRSPDR